MAGWSREAEALLRERFGRDNILALATVDNGHNDFSDENTRILRIRLTDGVLFSHGTRYELDFGASSGSAVTTGTSSRSVRK